MRIFFFIWIMLSKVRRELVPLNLRGIDPNQTKAGGELVYYTPLMTIHHKIEKKKLKIEKSIS